MAQFLDGARDDILIMGCLRDEWLRLEAKKREA